MAFEGQTKAEVASDARSAGRARLGEFERGVVTGGFVGFGAWAILEAMGFEIVKINPASIVGGVSLITARKGSAKKRGRRVGFGIGSVVPEVADKSVEFLQRSETFQRLRKGLSGDETPVITDNGAATADRPSVPTQEAPVTGAPPPPPPPGAPGGAPDNGAGTGGVGGLLLGLAEEFGPDILDQIRNALAGGGGGGNQGGSSPNPETV